MDKKEVAVHESGGVLAAFSGNEYEPDVSGMKSRYDTSLKAFLKKATWRLKAIRTM